MNEFELESLGYDMTKKEGWIRFEAMLLGPGLFERLPLERPEFSSDDGKSIRLWRKVLTIALFDVLRGPTSSATDPNEIARQKSSYKDTVHWLLKTKASVDYELDKTNMENSLTDFETVCMLADLDKSMVKGVFTRMIRERRKVFLRNDT